MFTGNKRQYSRCGLIGSGLINDQIKFNIIDISAAGLKVHTETPLVEDDIVKMNFSVYTRIEKKLKLSGKVTRHSAENPSLYEYVIEFQDLSEFEKIELDEVISQSCGIVNN